MKKKFLFLLLLAMSFSLFACKSQESIYLGDDTSVALIIGEKADMSFNYTAIVGLKMAEKDYDINLTILEHKNKAENFETKLLEAAEAKNNIIMTSSLLIETLEKNADKYPNITFVLYDGEIDWNKGDFNNVVCITYKSREASFLAGYAAASLSDSNIIGALAGMDIDANNDFIVGYIDGARLYNPEIKVIVEYIDSFSDPEKGKSIAKTMIDQGADVLFNIAGGSGQGIYEAVNDNEIIAIGVDSDQAMMYESKGEKEIANSIFTSVLKRVDQNLYKTIGDYEDQKLEYGKTRKLGLKEEAVSIAKNNYYETYIDKETRSEIEQLANKIISGEIIIESPMDKDEEFMEKLINSVKP